MPGASDDPLRSLQLDRVFRPLVREAEDQMMAHLAVADVCRLIHGNLPAAAVFGVFDLVQQSHRSRTARFGPKRNRELIPSVEIAAVAKRGVGLSGKSRGLMNLPGLIRHVAPDRLATAVFVQRVRQIVFEFVM